MQRDRFGYSFRTTLLIVPGSWAPGLDAALAWNTPVRMTITCGKCGGTFASGEKFSAHACAITTQAKLKEPTERPKPSRWALERNDAVAVPGPASAAQAPVKVSDDYAQQMLEIPFAAQELGNRFQLEVPNPDDYEIGKSYDAEAEDPDGSYPVTATIVAKHGREIAGTFEDESPPGAWACLLTRC